MGLDMGLLDTNVLYRTRLEMQVGASAGGVPLWELPAASSATVGYRDVGKDSMLDIIRGWEAQGAAAPSLGSSISNEDNAPETSVGLNGI